MLIFSVAEGTTYALIAKFRPRHSWNGQGVYLWEYESDSLADMHQQWLYDSCALFTEVIAANSHLCDPAQKTSQAGIFHHTTEISVSQLLKILEKPALGQCLCSPSRQLNSHQLLLTRRSAADSSAVVSKGSSRIAHQCCGVIQSSKRTYAGQSKKLSVTAKRKRTRNKVSGHPWNLCFQERQPLLAPELYVHTV